MVCGFAVTFVAIAVTSAGLHVHASQQIVELNEQDRKLSDQFAELEHKYEADHAANADLREYMDGQLAKLQQRFDELRSQ